MLRTSHMIYLLVPAVMLVSAIFAFKAIQYRALFPATNPQHAQEQPLDLIPILPNDPIIGQPNAPKTIIAFEDLACEGCSAQNTLLTQLEQAHPGKVKIIWKGLPVATYPFSSEPAHEYAYCANKQGVFSEFKEYAFANVNNLSKQTLDTIVTEIGINKPVFDECINSGSASTHIDTVRQLARVLHVQHVPTFFLDNEQIATPSSVEGWEAILAL